MLEFVDFLIVDEAGQVSPEVGLASFGLAKQAVIVGDIQQIEPVWNTILK
jgi:superfamily I DNA and/or RNA helicase